MGKGFKKLEKPKKKAFGFNTGVATRCHWNIFLIITCRVTRTAYS